MDDEHQCAPSIRFCYLCRLEHWHTVHEQLCKQRLPKAVSKLFHFFPQTKVVSDISDLNTGDAKQLEDIPVEQAVLLNFSLGQYGSRFLHFTNTASVYSPTFGDRSGF